MGLRAANLLAECDHAGGLRARRGSGTELGRKDSVVLDRIPGEARRGHFRGDECARGLRREEDLQAGVALACRPLARELGERG